MPEICRRLKQSGDRPDVIIEDLQSYFMARREDIDCSESVRSFLKDWASMEDGERRSFMDELRSEFGEKRVYDITAKTVLSSEDMSPENIDWAKGRNVNSFEAEQDAAYSQDINSLREFADFVREESKSIAFHVDKRYALPDSKDGRFARFKYPDKETLTWITRKENVRGEYVRLSGDVNLYRYDRTIKKYIKIKTLSPEDLKKGYELKKERWVSEEK